MRLKQVLISLLFTCSSTAYSNDTLFVFAPAEVRAQVVQKQISNVCPKMDVTVFGRAKDFRKQVLKVTPSAILSPQALLEHTDDFNILMKGQKSGSTEEEYVLVSVDSQFPVAEIASMKVGVVDLLGRKAMGAYVSKLFKGEIKLKRVTKVEDLLPLLTFGSVDGVFVSNTLYQQLKSKSNLNLVSTSVGINLGLIGAAMSSSASKDDVIGCITKFDAKLNSILGVETWLAI